ncbi:ABC transporter substrate-binding protein [Georgenia faecalis]|uniref:ABC transporter substrate-binding protein n=1 Tax=Georgenia faecalis TaxID=2483799 RepID=A0ABV9D8R2_9MICO|nr:ABC transporter substrate-binding protein [Georgenia faecalis]
MSTPRERRRPAARALTAALLALLALTGCAEQPAPAAPSAPSDAPDVTIGLTYTPDVQFAPFYVALEAGYYADAGVDVTLRHHGASESLFGALAAGEEQLVVAGGDEMVQARAEGVPVVGVATLYQRYPVVLLVPAGSDIETAADLAGRRVGVPGPFGETYFGLLAVLDGAGLSTADVDVAHIGYTQQAALAAGHVDAVMGFANNDAVQFARAGIDVRAIPLPEDVPLVGIGIGAREDTLAADRDAVAAVVEATLRGVADVVADPEAAVAVAAEHVPGLAGAEQRAAALATLEATTELYQADGVAPGASDPARWERMVAFLEAQGLLAGPVAVEDALVGLGG